jgi:hypothetical protein
MPGVEDQHTQYSCLERGSCTLKCGGGSAGILTQTYGGAMRLIPKSTVACQRSTVGYLKSGHWLAAETLLVAGNEYILIFKSEVRVSSVSSNGVNCCCEQYYCRENKLISTP